MDELLSKVREDNLITHDYLSIAVEFDNGQDITYYWSSELPVGTGFRCPITTWTARETHVVARSGLEGLGQWLNEESIATMARRSAATCPPKSFASG
jgi:hypothetical protein